MPKSCMRLTPRYIHQGNTVVLAYLDTKNCHNFCIFISNKLQFFLLEVKIKQKSFYQIKLHDPVENFFLHQIS